MNQNRQFIKNRHLACTILALLGVMTTAAHTADEDIDIPYTDTYGYVYDPVTGTYIKQGQPVAVDPSPNGTPPADSNTGVSIASNDPATMTGQTGSTPGQGSSFISAGLLVLLLIGAVLGYLFHTHRLKKAAARQG